MVIQDLLSADEKLSRKDLESIIGGTNVTSSFIASLSASVKIIYEIGQNFGSSIRRIVLNNLCGL